MPTRLLSVSSNSRAVFVKNQKSAMMRLPSAQPSAYERTAAFVAMNCHTQPGSVLHVVERYRGAPMSSQRLDKRPKAIILEARAGLVPLRGESGKLYGYFDPQRRVIEFKRGGQERETVDIKPYLEKP
jgi:hypothetical protein